MFYKSLIFKILKSLKSVRYWDFKDLKDKFSNAVIKSKFLPELKSELGEHFFNIKEVEQKTFDPKIMELLKKETDLENEYTEIIASAKIEFNGETYNWQRKITYNHQTCLVTNLLQL